MGYGVGGKRKILNNHPSPSPHLYTLIPITRLFEYHESCLAAAGGAQPGMHTTTLCMEIDKGINRFIDNIY